MRFLVIGFFILTSACTGLPKGIEPVGDFKLDSYLGKWYEIARLDHRFERGLTNVTAEYSLRESGRVNVVNQGFSSAKNELKMATGKAKFKSTPDIGHLLVSFFGPFYASYVVFELDDYRQAYVAGNNRKYLWYLARTPTVSEKDKAAFLAKAEERGFNTEGLIWVEQGTR